MNSRYSKREVGARVKEFRLSLGMTQCEFSSTLNWDVNTYRKIETGRTLLTTDKAQMLHEKYGLELTYLLTGERPDADDILKRMWIVSDRREKNNMMIRLFSYLIKLMQETVE